MKTILTVILLFIVSQLFPRMQAAEGGGLRHVVLVKFKQGTSAEDIKKVEHAFAALKGTISQVTSLEWGTNVSPEKRDKGYTHCFVLGFKNAIDRDAYLVHPEHKAFGGIIGPVLDDVLVVDFNAQGS